MLPNTSGFYDCKLLALLTLASISYFEGDLAYKVAPVVKAALFLLSSAWSLTEKPALTYCNFTVSKSSSALSLSLTLSVPVQTFLIES